MSQQNGQEPENEPTSEWQAYSNYATVTRNVASSIDAALTSYAAIQSAHSEGAPVTANQAAEARKNIMAATLMLLGEMQAQKGDGDEFNEVLNRWESGDQGDEGFVKRLHTLQLTKECPDWLLDLVIDVRRVGWELGYLQAGRYEETGDEDFEDDDVLQMG